MTNGQAISKLKHASIYTLCKDTREWREAFNLSIKALEKQIPQKPKLQRGCVGAYCPQCKGFVGDRLISYQYCRKCGQAIDWSEE